MFNNLDLLKWRRDALQGAALGGLVFLGLMVLFVAGSLVLVRWL